MMGQCSVAFGQKAPLLISGDFSNSSVDDFFKRLKSEYNIRFSYDAEAMKAISVKQVFNNQELESVLVDIFENKKFGFRKIGETYVIVPLRDEQAAPFTNSITLSGTVQDAESGEPLPYVNILVRGTKRYASADSKGDFIINDISSDTVLVTFTYVGYERKSLRVKQIMRQRDGVVLMNVSKSTLPEAIVVANGLSPVSSSAQAGLVVINPQVLGSLNGPGEPDIFRTAQLIPGVNATNELSNGLIIRGSPGDQSLIRIDGFTIYHMDHFFGVISAINPLAVKNIRVHKGGVESRLPSRIGGLVDITAKEGNRYDPGGKIVMSPLSVSGYLETPLSPSNKASLMIAARRSTTDLWNSPTYNELFSTIYNSNIISTENDSPTESARYVFSDVISKITWRPTPQDVIFLSGYASNDELGISYSAVDNAARFAYKYFDDSQWGNRGVGAGWSRTFSQQWNQELSLGWSQYSSDLNAVDTLEDLRFQDFQRSFREDYNTLRDLSARFQLGYNKNQSKFYGGLIANQVDIDRVGTDFLPDSSLNAGATWVSIFAEWAGEKDDLKWNAGIRNAYYSANNNFYPEWSLNATWGKPDSVNFKASVSRVHQYVHRLRQQSLFLNQPDTWTLSTWNNVPVQVSDQFILGVIVPIGDWALDIEGFLKNNRGVALDVTQWYWRGEQQNNVISGSGRNIGIDFFIKREKARSDFWISYTLANSTMSFEELDLANKLVQGFEHQHEAKVYYEWKWKKWNVWTTWVYGSGRPFTPLLGETTVSTVNGTQLTVPIFGEINSGRIIPYHRLDAGVGYTTTSNKNTWSFILNFTNVYNRTNVRDIQYLNLIGAAGQMALMERSIAMIGFIPSLQIGFEF